MGTQKQVLGPDDVRRAVTRMAHEIIERNHGLAGVALVGLQRGGGWLAESLGAGIARLDHPVPVGAIAVEAVLVAHAFSSSAMTIDTAT
mgnify:CR=1 FL=1